MCEEFNKQIAALIAENERLVKERRTEHQSLRSDKARNSLYMMIATSLIDDHPYERTGSDWDYEHPIHDKIISLLSERDQLKAENDALRKDAERYEWLKINSSVMLKKTVTYTAGLVRINTIYPASSELDLCLDAAMGKGEQS